MKEYILYPICKILDCVLPRKYKKGIPVLAYHSVSNKRSMLAVTPGNFKKQIEYLRSRGYKNIKPDNLFKEENSKNKIIISFDDGLKDNLDTAMPILDENDYKAVIFIATKYIGEKGSFMSKEDDKNFLMLNDEEIIKLEDSDWDVCNHLHSHRNLSDLSATEIKKEYITAREILDSIMNKKENTKIIAYPRNKKNDVVIDVLKNAGVKMAFSGAVGTVDKESNIMDLPRIEIDADTSFLKFKLAVSPSFQMLKKLLIN